MDVTKLQKQKKIVTYLKELDLSSIEINLYLKLLETGPIKIRELANKINIKRTTTYFYIEELLKKKLVTKLVKNSERLICANEPSESIRKLVDNKLELANKIQTSFPGILKIINDSLPHKNLSGAADVKYYYGVNSVKNIYLELIYAKEIRGITNISEFLNIFPDTFQIVDKAIQKDKHKKFFEIVDDSLKTNLALKDSVETTNNRYQCKYFPEDMKISSTFITIYDGKVSIVNSKDNITGIILQDNTLYNNFNQLFDLIWNNISKYQ